LRSCEQGGQEGIARGDGCLAAVSDDQNSNFILDLQTQPPRTPPGMLFPDQTRALARPAVSHQFAPGSGRSTEGTSFDLAASMTGTAAFLVEMTMREEGDQSSQSAAATAAFLGEMTMREEGDQSSQSAAATAAFLGEMTMREEGGQSSQSAAATAAFLGEMTMREEGGQSSQSAAATAAFLGEMTMREEESEGHVDQSRTLHLLSTQLGGKDFVGLVSLVS
jgi:hypothetical protein